MINVPLALFFIINWKSYVDYLVLGFIIGGGNEMLPLACSYVSYYFKRTFIYISTLQEEIFVCLL